MNLYFCGIIGSGKTAIGSRLAQRLGLEFCDLDREMDVRLGYSFHRLVQEQGWIAFRELEYSICKYFAAKHHALACLGGGTVRYEWNMDAIKGTGPVILLEASIDTLVERVSRADRPRVNPGVTIREDITKIWESSYHKYLQAADFVYRTDEKSLPEEVDELEQIIRTHELFQGVSLRR